MSMPSLKVVVLLLIALNSLPAIGGPSGDDLSSCFADNTTGRDRKDLARWMFLAMAAHPEMQQLAKVSQDDQEQASKAMAGIFTRLLSDSCNRQAKSAIKDEGSQAMANAFGSLGRLAMQELMSHQTVNSSLSGFERYVDKKKLEAALSQK